MLFWSDADPGFPENKLDRGSISIYPRAGIAGDEVPPERILERLGINPFSGDQVALPQQILDRLQHAEPPAPTHWKYAQPVSEAVYRHHFDHLRWAERNQPDAPALAPRRRIDPAQMALPNFDRENAI